jgi:hypothetical protein
MSLSYKTIAQLFAEMTMDRTEEYLAYVRPTTDELERFGHLIASSNWGPDGEPVSSGVSFSPTEMWEFSDGSRLEVTCSTVRVQ